MATTSLLYCNEVKSPDGKGGGGSVWRLWKVGIPFRLLWGIVDKAINQATSISEPCFRDVGFSEKQLGPHGPACWQKVVKSFPAVQVLPLKQLYRLTCPIVVTRAGVSVNSHHGLSGIWLTWSDDCLNKNLPTTHLLSQICHSDWL